MNQDITTRAASAADIPAIAEIADANLFPGEMTQEMMAPFLKDPDCARWRVALRGEAVIGFLFAVPEEMTDRTWNIKALAVKAEARRSGAGATLISDFETELGASLRVAVIDTTQTPDQAAGRALYVACGYHEAGVIPDFWEQGGDKVTFVKALS